MASSARPGTGPSEEFRFPGNRLGLPEHGPGSVASWGRRILALLLDWLIAGLIASAVTSKPIWAGGNDFNTAQLITFFGMTAILTGSPAARSATASSASASSTSTPAARPATPPRSASSAASFEPS